MNNAQPSAVIEPFLPGMGPIVDVYIEPPRVVVLADGETVFDADSYRPGMRCDEADMVDDVIAFAAHYAECGRYGEEVDGIDVDGDWWDRYGDAVACEWEAMQDDTD